MLPRRYAVAVLLSMVLLALSPFAAAGEWQLSRRDDNRDIRVYLRDNPASSYNSFYAVTRIKTRLSTVVAVLADVPAMPEWIARMKSAKLLRRDDRDAWVHGTYKLPYPFLEREAVLHSSLRQDKNGVVEVITRAEPGLMAANPKRVRLLDMQGTWRLTPEKDGFVKIEMWGEGNPGGYVPPVLFNYNLPDEPAQTLKHLRQMLTREKYQAKTFSYIREP